MDIERNYATVTLYVYAMRAAALIKRFFSTIAQSSNTQRTCERPLNDDPSRTPCYGRTALDSKGRGVDRIIFRLTGAVVTSWNIRGYSRRSGAGQRARMDDADDVMNDVIA